MRAWITVADVRLGQIREAAFKAGSNVVPLRREDGRVSDDRKMHELDHNNPADEARAREIQAEGASRTAWVERRVRALEAARDRYRAALERIAHHEREGDYAGQVNAMRAIAMVALSQPHAKPHAPNPECTP